MKWHRAIVRILPAAVLLIQCGGAFNHLFTDPDPDQQVPRVIHPQIKEREPSLYRVYRRHCTDAPDLKGYLEISFYVKPSGMVVLVRKESSDMDSKAFVDEICQIIGRWRFYNLAFKGQPVKVVYRFEFEPKTVDGSDD